MCRAFRTRLDPAESRTIHRWRSARQISSFDRAPSGLLIVSPSKDLNRNRDAVIWVVTADHQDERQSPTNKSSDIEPLMPIMSIDSAMVTGYEPTRLYTARNPSWSRDAKPDHSLRRWHHLG